MRIRSFAKIAFCTALGVCAMQENFSWAFGTISSFSQVNGVYLDFTNFHEKPAAFRSSPFSIVLLPQLGQSVASDALWFSIVANKSLSVVNSCTQAESKHSITIATTYSIEPFFNESLENPYSCFG